jgi:hypothetical protein
MAVHYPDDCVAVSVCRSDSSDHHKLHERPYRSVNTFSEQLSLAAEQLLHAGALSAITLLMTCLGSAARIFTTLQEAKNAGPMLTNHIVGGGLAFILLIQVP